MMDCSNLGIGGVNYNVKQPIQQEELVRAWSNAKTKDGMFLSKIANFQEVYQKVNFVEKELWKDEILINETGSNIFPARAWCKSDAISEEVRKIGNTQFTEKNFEEALIIYNHSIALAQRGSVHIAIGYANRSAVLQKLGLYKEALINIEMAKQFGGLPEEILKKLDVRNKDCIKALTLQQKKQIKQEINLNLSYKSDAKLPFMADGLEFREAANNKIEFFTKRDLKVGDVVCVSPALSFIACTYEMCFIICHNCFQRNPYMLIPCYGCISTMYCSEECREVSYNSHHKYECKYNEEILFNFCEIVGPLKLSLIGISLFDNIEELLKYCTKKTSNDSEFQKKDLYKSAFNFPVFHDSSDNKNIFFLEQVGLIIKLISDELKFKNKNDINLFTNLLYHHMQNREHSWTITYPVRLFLANPISLNFRHSCAPNVFPIPSNKNELHYIVTKPIKANNPLLNANYCLPFYCEKKDKRQLIIKSVTGEKCKCEACVDDWKLQREYEYDENDLPFGKTDLINIEKNFFHLYPKFLTFLTQNAEEYPSFRTIMVEMIIMKQLVEAIEINKTFAINFIDKELLEKSEILNLSNLLQQMRLL